MKNKCTVHVIYKGKQFYSTLQKQFFKNQITFRAFSNLHRACLRTYAYSLLKDAKNNVWFRKSWSILSFMFITHNSKCILLSTTNFIWCLLPQKRIKIKLKNHIGKISTRRKNVNLNRIIPYILHIFVVVNKKLTEHNSYNYGIMICSGDLWHTKYFHAFVMTSCTLQ